MSRHLGDFDAATTIYGKFTTYRPTTGAPYALAGSPALSVYKDSSTTQSTTGVTLTADFDSVAGLNHYAIDLSADGTFYAAGSHFDVVITTGTVDSVSAVGTVVGSFTIRKNSALKPTSAGRSLDVSATGEAGLDWANVGSPTTAVDLSGTTIAITQRVDVVKWSGDAVPVPSVAGYPRVDMAYSAGEAAYASDGTIAAASSTTVTFPATNSAGVAIPDDDRYVHTSILITAGTGAGQVVRTTTAAAGTRQYNVAAASMPVQLDNTSKYVLVGPTTDTAAVADRALGRNVDGGSDGGRTVSEALQFLRNKWTISGGTLTVYAANDTDVSWTSTVTTAAGDPISSSDPT